MRLVVAVVAVTASIVAAVALLLRGCVVIAVCVVILGILFCLIWTGSRLLRTRERDDAGENNNVEEFASNFSDSSCILAAAVAASVAAC